MGNLSTLSLAVANGNRLTETLVLFGFTLAYLGFRDRSSMYYFASVSLFELCNFDGYKIKQRTFVLQYWSEEAHFV